MKNLFRSFAILAASALALSACNREVLPETPVETHSISFIASAPQTKTSATIDTGAKTVDYSWSESDKTRFSVYEVIGDNYSAATTVTAEIVDDSMILDAKFNGAATPGAKYFALLNSGVQSNQEATNTSYDQDSDVLVSEVVASDNIDGETLLLSFKRENAFALMTAKDLDEGAFISSASITATNGKLLAAEYDYKTNSFAEEGSNAITLDVLSEIEGGQASVFVSTLPVESAALNVAVVTVDDNEAFVAAYEKSFKSGSTIDFTRGDVRAFGIGMNKVESQTFDLTTDNTITCEPELIAWQSGLVSIKNEGTNANNYCPPTRTSTRFYENNVVTIHPRIGTIRKIEFEAQTEAYARVLNNSTWTNAHTSLDGTTITIVPEDGYSDVTCTVSGTTGHKSIKVYYGDPVAYVPTVYTVTLADDSTELTSEDGSAVTLPSREGGDRYSFSGWSMTNLEEETTTKPEIIKVGEYVPTEDVTLYPIYYRVEGDGAEGKPSVTIADYAAANSWTGTSNKYLEVVLDQ